MNLFDLFDKRNYENEPRDQRDSISSAFGDYGPERFNPGKYPWERGPGAPQKQEGQAYWNKDRVGVEPMFGTAETGREQAIRESDYAQSPQTLFDQAKDLGGQAWDFATDTVGAGIDNARGAIDDFTAWDETPDGQAAAKNVADATNTYKIMRNNQDAIREQTDRAAEGDGFGSWIADKYNNVDDFSRFLRKGAEEVRIPVPGSENLKFDNTEKAMMRGMPGGLMYGPMKYLYDLGGQSFDKLRGYWD